MQQWERQPGETVKAHEAFRTYIALAQDRSCSKVAQSLRKSRTLITRWSARWDWVRRSIEYDREMERREREGEIRARIQMRGRHAAVALLALTKVTLALEKLDPEQMKASGLARLLGESCRIERLARGEPDGDEHFATVHITVNRKEAKSQS